MVQDKIRAIAKEDEMMNIYGLIYRKVLHRYFNT